MSHRNASRPVALVLLMLALAVCAAPLAAVDDNERQEALRHLAIVRKEAGILTRLAAMATVPSTSPASDPRAVSAELLAAADKLHAAVQGARQDGDLEGLYEKLDEAADAIEPALPFFPPKGGARSRFSNVRWSVGRVAALIGLEDEEQEKYTVGPVSSDQSELLLTRVEALLERAVEFSSALAKADPEMMYRDLLRTQMSALIDPAATLKVTVNTPRPWWTPEAYQAVSRISRLVANTRLEIRKLTPDLLDMLKQVWTAGEELESAANDIEHGARASGPDAKIEYLPQPKH